MGKIDEIRESGEHNYQTAKNLLGDTFTLADDVLDLYRVLAEIATKSPLAVRDEYVTALQFLVGSQYQLTMSVLAALRGHVIDALRDTRMAIELCAFAAHVKRNPKLVLVWLEAGAAGAAYEAYRRQFTASKLFPRGLREWQELYKRYDHAAKLSHPSVYKMAGHTRFARTPAALNIEFHFFQLRRDDASEPTRTFLWIIDTRLKVLRAFENVLAQILAHDRARWQLRITTMDAKLDGHKEKWSKVCAPSLRPASSPGAIIIPSV